MHGVQKQGKFASTPFQSGERLSLENVVFPRLHRSLTFHSGQDKLLRKITFFHICKNAI